MSRLRRILGSKLPVGAAALHICPQARIFNEALDKRFQALAETAERLERERMTGWIETFATALRQDLIDATDFRPCAQGRR